MLALSEYLAALIVQLFEATFVSDRDLRCAGGQTALPATVENRAALGSVS
jgi:hypothetical protein